MNTSSHSKLSPLQVDLHFRTLDFGQVTVGSSNVRNLAVTNNLAQAVLVELVGLEGQSELAGTGPPAQVVPAGATAGFDVHFKCNTEQVCHVNERQNGKQTRSYVSCSTS